jgi:hypothetical protein
MAKSKKTRGQTIAYKVAVRKYLDFFTEEQIFQ